MAFKKMTKESLVNYIKEQAQNLYKIQVLKEQKENIEKDIQLLNERKYSKQANEFIGKEISHLEKDKGYKHDRAVAAAINIAKEKEMKVPAKNESKEIEHDPKAAVRNRGNVVFSAESSKVKDDKDHFPINSESQARNAIARANQFSKPPSWYKGSTQDLVDAIVKAVKKKYPDMEISKEAKTKK